MTTAKTVVAMATTSMLLTRGTGMALQFDRV